jgi:uncharacterized protein YqgC (DUF456 family)
METTVAPMLALIILAAALLGGLLMVPLGLPGLWVMLGAAILYWVVVPAGGIGLVTVLAAGAIVLVAEVLEYTISGRYTRKYGGSSRASWGAILGGLVGAIVGVPIPVIGSLAGAFVGAFAGAFIGELTVGRDERGDPARVATGALVGRAVAAAVKSALGLVVAVLLMGAAIAG